MIVNNTNGAIIVGLFFCGLLYVDADRAAKISNKSVQYLIKTLAAVAFSTLLLIVGCSALTSPDNISGWVNCLIGIYMLSRVPAMVKAYATRRQEERAEKRPYLKRSVGGDHEIV